MKFITCKKVSPTQEDYLLKKLEKEAGASYYSVEAPEADKIDFFPDFAKLNPKMGLHTHHPHHPTTNCLTSSRHSRILKLSIQH